MFSKTNSVLLLSLFFITLCCCYSFRGISIDPNVNTFYVKPFENTAPKVVPTLAQTFTDDLTNKIRNESRLNYSNTDPDIEFSGTITRYSTSALAPEPGQTTSFNRINMTVSVEFISNINEKDNWKQNFDWYYDFESNVNELDIQDDAIANINEQIIENIFNRAFTNW